MSRYISLLSNRDSARVTSWKSRTLSLLRIFCKSYNAERQLVVSFKALYTSACSSMTGDSFGYIVLRVFSMDVILIVSSS